MGVALLFFPLKHKQVQAAVLTKEKRTDILINVLETEIPTASS